jgi:hypothetical protein
MSTTQRRLAETHGAPELEALRRIEERLDAIERKLGVPDTNRP